MNEGKLFEEQDRGAQAESLLRNPILVEAFDVLSETYLNAWKESPVKAEDDRERIFLMYKNLLAVRAHLEEIVNTGKLANLELNT